jgi:glucose-1-phosphate adenylyltransferase
MAVIMAGGRGQRLKHLTDNRAKPATPFGGKYRIIDFSLSNCVNSGIRQIFILTQYKAHSLIQHVQRGWGYLHGELGEFIDIVPAQQQLGEVWYRGTADAVYQNLDIIEQHRPEMVLILAGDHVYKMDYGPLIAFHKENGADITIGGVQVPLNQANEVGVMTLGEDHRVIGFDEKPKEPKPMPGREGVALASMGIYVIGTEFLRATLTRDAADPNSAHDFGRNVIPEAVANRRVFAYPFEDVETKAQAYWRDVGTVDGYFSANMELVHVSPELDDRGRLHHFRRYRPRVAAVLQRRGR